MNPGPFSFSFSDGNVEAEDQEVLVTPEVYQQNEQLEPDGATLRRVILDYYHVAVFSSVNFPQANGLGLFFDHAIIVHDANADLGAVLSTSNWSDTMIKERVLWYMSHDYTLAWNPAASIIGGSNVTGPSQDLVPIPHFRVDTKIAAKLMQNKTVSFITRITSVGFVVEGDQLIEGNYRMQARMLIGGRF